MLLQLSNPIFGGNNVVAYFLTCLFIKSSICLTLYKMFKKTGINGINNIKKERSRRSFLGCKLIVHVSFDLRIILHLLNDIVHWELIVAWKLRWFDLTVFEAGLFRTKQLTDENTINFMVRI